MGYLNKHDLVIENRQAEPMLFKEQRLRLPVSQKISTGFDKILDYSVKYYFNES